MSLNSTSQTAHFQYVNASTNETHEVWFDSADTLKTKYHWAGQAGMRAVGMWTPGATWFDEESMTELWGAIPKDVPSVEPLKSDDDAAG
eukprot:COSAG04_NODE_22983_length_346_cov_0.514170_1_plen_88_part_01